MDSWADWQAARAALEWQLELGADEAIGEAPVDRFALETGSKARAEAPKPAATPGPKAAPRATPPQVAHVDPVAEAAAAANTAPTLAALRDALGRYEHCELKKGARNLVFSDGTPGARVMIIGEAPGRDEDREGRPFVGRAGQLLDKMLGAIGLDRGGVYITNVMPWRPPQNRDPQPEEIAMMQPFLRRHIALAAPEVLVVMGNISAQAMLGRRGITRLRGTWTEAEGRPVMPMVHPAYLLRNPAAKREAWADLLALNARLKG